MLDGEANGEGEPMDPATSDAKAITGFTPTREAGLGRLDAVAAKLGGHYRQHRNHDLGPQDRSNVSVLSPYVTHRLLTERELVERAVAEHGGGTPEKFVQEVFWRTYWHGWLEMRPHIWSSYTERRDAALERVEGNGGMMRDYRAAMNGETGIEGFDDWAVEIRDTGYLHNHARMWFASIWVHTLRLDWALGSDFFYRHLIDGDPASNTLSWRWVAGLQTRGKAYAATQSNIARFTNGRFNPRGLNENPVPLEEDEDLSPDPIDPVPPLPGGKAVVLVHSSDCRTEDMRWPGTTIVGAFGASHVATRSPLDVSEAVAAFVPDAVRDGVERAGTHYDAPTVKHHGEGAAEALVAHARDVGADHVVTPYMRVGDGRAWLDGLKRECREEGLPIHEARRDWDAAAWPYATKGFFKFKERIPKLMREAGL